MFQYASILEKVKHFVVSGINSSRFIILDKQSSSLRRFPTKLGRFGVVNLKNNESIGGSNWGARDAPPLLHAVFGKNWPNNRLATHWKGWCSFCFVLPWNIS